MASTTILIYAMLAAVGLVLGPFALRFALGVAPGGLKKRAAKWQLHRALNMGDGWLVHQTGDRQYVLRPIRPDAGALDIDGERVDLDNLGHIATKTGSIPMGVSYGPGAVDDSPLVGVSPDAHIEQVPGEPTDDETVAGGETDG